MKTDRLMTYTTPLELLHRANSTVSGPFLAFLGSAEPLGEPVKVYRRHFATADILFYFRPRTAGQNVCGATVMTIITILNNNNINNNNNDYDDDISVNNNNNDDCNNNNDKNNNDIENNNEGNNNNNAVDLRNSNLVDVPNFNCFFFFFLVLTF